MSYYRNESLCVQNREERKERQKQEAKADLVPLCSDFLQHLPSYIRDVVDSAKWTWKNEPWFQEAWNKYRDHVLNAVANNQAVQGPGVVFNDYIDEQIEKDYKLGEAADILHCDLTIVEMVAEHDGITLEHAAKKTGTNLLMTPIENVAGIVLKGNPSGGASKVAKAASKSKSKAASKSGSKAASHSGSKANSEFKTQLSNGKALFRGLLVAGILAGITVGALKRRAKRKEAEQALKQQREKDAYERKSLLADTKAAIKSDAMMREYQSQYEPHPDDRERYPAGDPSGKGGQFKPKGA